MLNDNFILNESNSYKITSSSFSPITEMKNKIKIKDVEDETNDGKLYF